MYFEFLFWLYRLAFLICSFMTRQKSTLVPQKTSLSLSRRIMCHLKQGTSLNFSESICISLWLIYQMDIIDIKRGHFYDKFLCLLWKLPGTFILAPIVGKNPLRLFFVRLQSWFVYTRRWNYSRSFELSFSQQHKHNNNCMALPLESIGKHMALMDQISKIRSPHWM